MEKGGGVVKDEEEMAEAGEVEKEKRVMHKCEECAKNVRRMCHPQSEVNEFFKL